LRILHFSDPHVQLPLWRERPLRDFGPRMPSWCLPMPNSARVLTRLAAIVLVGGLTLGVAVAALVPGVRQIATANHYTASVKTLGDLSSPTTVFDANGGQIGKLGVL